MTTNTRATAAELASASAAALMDLVAMIEAADRREVWVVNAGTRLRVDNLRAALAAHTAAVDAGTVA